MSIITSVRVRENEGVKVLYMQNLRWNILSIFYKFMIT